MGGLAPYSYAWHANGQLVCTQKYYSTSFVYYSFYLQLNVTDARGGSSSDSKYVNIDYNATTC